MTAVGLTPSSTTVLRSALLFINNASTCPARDVRHTQGVGGCACGRVGLVVVCARVWREGGGGGLWCHGVTREHGSAAAGGVAVAVGEGLWCQHGELGLLDDVHRLMLTWQPTFACIKDLVARVTQRLGVLQCSARTENIREQRIGL